MRTVRLLWEKPRENIFLPERKKNSCFFYMAILLKTFPKGGTQTILRETRYPVVRGSVLLQLIGIRGHYWLVGGIVACWWTLLHQQAKSGIPYECRGVERAMRSGGPSQPIMAKVAIFLQWKLDNVSCTFDRHSGCGVSWHEGDHPVGFARVQLVQSRLSGYVLCVPRIHVPRIHMNASPWMHPFRAFTFLALNYDRCISISSVDMRENDPPSTLDGPSKVHDNLKYSKSMGRPTTAWEQSPCF